MRRIGVGRNGGPSSHREYVRARPFANWLNDRHEFYFHLNPAHNADALSRLLAEIGWPVTEAGARRLYRYRYMMMSGSQNGVKGSRATEWFERDVVEDALHMAGVSIYDLYPELGCERDIPLEPTAWCASCREHTTPVDGVCPWCEWRISDGHMNLRAAA